MKKGWVFLLGFISGIAFIFVVSLIFAPNVQEEDNDEMIFFEEEGECLSNQPFEVFQVLGDDIALAREIDKQYSSWNSTTDLLILLVNDEGEYYYDDQVITIPTGMCMRQIGIYRYPTAGGDEKTVPIAKISK